MKPLIGVHLSEESAARLEAAARRSGVTKSILIESALDRFLGADGNVNDITAIVRCLTAVSGRLEQLDRDLAIVGEAVALHARFDLAVTPPMPAAAQRAACARGAERFEEFAAQVGRRVDQKVPLMRETIERLRAAKRDPSVGGSTDARPCGTNFAASKPDLRASTGIADPSAPTAAAREDGSNGGFPARAGGSFH